MNRSIFAAAVFLLPACVWLTQAYALRNDAQQPIEIEADSMVLDEQPGISRYTGQVILTQGSIRITAEELVIYTEAGELQKMEMQGTTQQRASFKQLSEDGAEVTGHAMRMEYRAAKSHLILLENAELKQNNNFVQSQRIDYNTRQNSLIAGQNRPNNKEPKGENPERVRIVITPDDGPDAQ